ncbi:ankyrin [Lentithecium fluviatile CBS 122367]|uniref:Ankyrin n=1 Tax=Lentithecium fluviatile CBS 122367 TaxID=1168545 RepID=A0A6G1JER1_9PLEO|nr:ankyrin [Lentithecium fluviatile CBS 122367]
MTGEKLAEYEIPSLRSTARRTNPIDTQDLSALRAFIDGSRSFLTGLIRKGRGWTMEDSVRARTVLHTAATLGYADCVRLIVENLTEADQRKSFVNKLDDRGWTALHYATAGQYPEICKGLLRQGASLNLKNNESCTAFDLAVKGGHRETLDSIARYAGLPSKDIADTFGLSKTHIRARNGTLSHMELGAMCLEELEETDFLGRAPLYRATEMNMGTVARVLIEKVNLAMSELLELSFLADSNDGLDLLYSLLSRLPRDSLGDDSLERTTAIDLLMKIIKQNDPVPIMLLHNAGLDINAADPSDLSSAGTALSRAIEWRMSKAAVCLIQCGADTAAKYRDGFPCLHNACQKGLVDVVGCLLEHGANPEFQVENADPRYDLVTPLHAAFHARSMADSVAITRLLLKHGASFSTAVGDSWPEAWYAVYYWHSKISRVDKLSSSEQAACDALQDLLSEHGCAFMMEKADIRGCVSIHKAAERNDLKALMACLDERVPPDWATYHHWTKLTPLQIAVRLGHFEVAKALLERGADVGIIRREYMNVYTDYYNEGGVSFGKRHEREKIVKLLLEEIEQESKGYFADRDPHLNRDISRSLKQERAHDPTAPGEKGSEFGVSSVERIRRLLADWPKLFITGAGGLFLLLLLFYLVEINFSRLSF